MDGIDLSNLTAGLMAVTWQSVVMMAVAGLLIYFAIAKEYEPTLLLPIGIGCIIGNLPLSAMIEEGGMLYVLKQAGIDTELFPLLIFVGVGAMMDFRPLLAQPVFALMGAAGQFGIFMWCCEFQSIFLTVNTLNNRCKLNILNTNFLEKLIKFDWIIGIIIIYNSHSIKFNAVFFK